MGKVVYWGILTVAAAVCGIMSAYQHQLFWTLFGAMTVAFDLHFFFKALDEYNKSQEDN